MTSYRSTNGKVNMTLLTHSIRTFCVLAASLLVAMGTRAQVIPTPFFCSFYDSASTVNGNLMPVGSKITAFDPSGVWCGQWTVSELGKYPFTPVYGDDNNTVVDEGAINAETITFKINGVTAITTGDATWANQNLKPLRLATSQNVSWNVLTTFTSLPGSFADTIRFSMELQNTGNGTDFFDIDATPDNGNFVALPQSDNFYVNAGQNVILSFDIATPVFGGGGADTVIAIDWTVRSRVDPTKFLDGTVELFFTITDVDDNPDANLPGGFALNQNYPNPFNPTTTIGYSIPQSADVSLEVYNVIGQQVSRIELGRQPAGEHTFNFDGSRLASGVYLYRIDAGFSNQMKKMVLIK